MILDETTNRICIVLGDAWSDINGWIQLAEKQRADDPDPNHSPNMPSISGIEQSRKIQKNLGELLKEFRG